MNNLTIRQQGEAIERFGDDLWKLVWSFCDGFDTAIVDRVNAVPHQEHLEQIALSFRRLGATIQDECDAAGETA